MKRLLVGLIMVSGLVSVSSFAGTPSSKFAATWTKGISVVSVIDLNDCAIDCSDLNLNAGFKVATIKVPQDKELLAGLSAEVGLTTDTSLKGKEGGKAKALADAGAWVVLFAVPAEGNGTAKMAQPGPVALSRRVQALEARLGGVLVSCDDDNDDGTIVVEDDCVVDDEEIGLMQKTVASHHFNFVIPNMDQGTYDVYAFFLTRAQGSVDIDESATAEYGGSIVGSSYAKAWVRKTMLTLQQVRAAEGGVIQDEIVEF
jgi:hypothetical protein